MTHPQPPAGPHDPQQPNAEPPTQAVPATPQPRSATDPTVPHPPVSAPPQPPFASTPDPSYAGASQPPYAAPPQQAVPGQPWPQPPFAGTSYPAAGPGAQTGTPGYGPGAPGYPLAGTPAPAQGSKKTVVVVAVTAAVLALLCCAGGIVAAVIGFNRAAEQAVEARPTPAVTRSVGQTPGGKTPPSPAEPSAASGETRDMSVGETLVIDDSDGTVEITVTKFSTSTKACKSYGLKPDEGMYVIATVTVKVTKGRGSINPLFFQWVAQDGTETNAIGGALSGCGKPLSAGNNLSTGTKRTGSVVFDVPNTSGVLEYQHLFETAGSWKP
ncbi:DUF4352 domain-containing protein [Micromonospora sp. GCM10011542]|uniref:DUF4352 domain-containing protein n=1 Tax=Micromonospora sp. GCM10011542 TaxID=3317337 RepID=UPI003607698B